MRTPLRSVVAAVTTAVIFTFTGCKPDDDIRAYTAPKEPTTKVDIPTSDEKYRMLAAVIPADEKYFWSVKLAGPTEAVSPLSDDFVAFVRSIQPGIDSNSPPKFTAPAGWEVDAPKQMRLATFKKNGVEMYLSTPTGGGMLANVNRWRGQVGLRELKEDELSTTMTPIKLGDTTAYTVDLRGPTWSGGMMGGKGPFQK